MKIRSVGAELFHADGRTDRYTDRHKPSRRNSVNAPTNATKDSIYGSEFHNFSLVMCLFHAPFAYEETHYKCTVIVQEQTAL